MSEENKKANRKSKSEDQNIEKVKKIKKNDKSEIKVEDVYEGLTHHQHILLRPDSYIGPTLVDEVRMFIIDEDTNKIIEDVINYIAGFFKIFDEILVNARDHTVRDPTCKNISISINKIKGIISIWNDGNGIPIISHPKFNKYLPEVIFGNLLTSSNYKNKGRTVGGRNGYGSKLCLERGTLIPLFNGKIKKVEDIERGEKLIGDDGLIRNVIGKETGEGKLFEVSQQCYQSYVVNEDHILCLRMPDHKVIFWSATRKSWNILWFDKQTMAIKKKSIRVYEQEKIECNECGEMLSSSLNRHYKRLHPDIEVPRQPRKLPTTIAPDAQEVKSAKANMEIFARTIPNDNTLDISVKDYMKLNETTKKRLCGYLGLCVQWIHTDVALDPYVLGLWLGDGFQNGYAFAINIKDDAEILEYLEEWGLTNDVSIKNTAANPYYYGVSSLSKRRVAPLKKLLSQYGLVNNKHIPKDYLVNSRDVRLKVLAGLIDSDGHVSREGIRINIAQGMNHKKLAEDIIFLTRSLGFKCCPSMQDTQWTYEGELRRGVCISINISGEGVEDIPTKVARKKCCAPVKRDTSGTGCLTIKRIANGEFVGLAVDGNQRFVLGDFTVTHNCNIYSKEFEIHTIGFNKLSDDNAKKIEYKQTFKNNMYDILEPEINTKINQSTKTFTKITFLPDYEKFGMTGLTKDMYSLLVKRCYDIAASTPSSVKITFNDQEIKCREFKDYIKLYYDDDKDKSTDKSKITYEKVNSRWEVGIGFNKNIGDRYISFVNGISTFQGGTHVIHVVNTIVAKVTAFINNKKEYKKLKIMPNTIKQYLTFFINCIIEDPGFNSQTKEYMTSKIADWCTCGKNCIDVKCDISDDYIKRLCSNGLMAEVVKMSEFKEMRDLDKTDGKKVGSIRGIPNLEDANWAGKQKSHLARLILTEGNSAKAFAVSGVRVIGRDQYGIFPLKGKLLNVRKAHPKKIVSNAEFGFIKRIMGLKQRMKYKDVSKLRYGGIIILTDQDPDGSHIKGLIINMLEYFWPELLQIEGFITAYNTPIVKVWKKSDKKRKNIKEFYGLSEFESWKKKQSDKINIWEHKYYKGLGTSSNKEAKESFHNFEDNIVTFLWEKNDINENENEEEKNNNNNNMLKMKADLKKKSHENSSKKNKKNINDDNEENNANDDNDNDDNDNNEDDDNDNNEEDNANKDIISNKDDDDDDENTYAYMKSKSHCSISKGFDDNVILRKEWLRKFKRSDALEYKPKMKLTYSDFIDKELIFFSNTDNDRSIPSMADGLKPSQRMIMYCCFKRPKAKEIKVAQLAGYVSENTDYHHGEASLQGAIIGIAQIYPGSNNISLLRPIGYFGGRREGGKDAASPRYIFTELDPVTSTIYRHEDEEILEYNYDDDRRVEPKTYIPIIPMILINGAEGIGTGFSTKIPPHNPKDVVTNLKRLINDQELIDMIPWYNGFKGTIEKNPKKDNAYIIKGKYNVDGNKIIIEDIPIVNGWTDNYISKMESKVFITKDDKNKIESIRNDSGNYIIDITIIFKGQELQKIFKDVEGTLDKYLLMSQNLTVTNLHLFNHEGKLVKYDSIHEILHDFYTFRLNMYEKRKEYYLKKLENDLDIAKYKVKFIKEFIKGTILIAKKSGDEVSQQLEDKKYPRLANDHRTAEVDRTYRYLTDMSLLTLTNEKIAELERSMEKCKALYDEYLNTSIKKIWLKELDEFLIAYKTWCEWWNSEIDELDQVDPDDLKEGKKGKKGKKNKKDNDDDDDDNTHDDDNNNISKKETKKKSKKETKKKTEIVKNNDKKKDKKIKIIKKIND